MPRLTSIARIVVVLAVAGGLAACSKTLNMDNMQKVISDGITTQMGLKITSVSCPADSRPLKAGDSFECTAMPDGGGKLTIKVTQKDDAGNVTWDLTKSEGLLSMDALQTTIKSGLLEQAKIDATVTCGGKWRVSKTGDAFDCQATDPAGKVLTVTVTVEDTDGNVHWKLK
jgi:hypothetical protein